MSGSDRGERAIELVRPVDPASLKFTENRGVTMDSGYPIQPVSALPTEPAMPPSSPSSSSDVHGVDTAKD